MKREYLPPRTEYSNENARPEFQGALNSCTRFAITGPLEFMSDRAGEPVDFSVRFLWWFTDKAALSVDSAVATLNRVGVCIDALCPYRADTSPPYEVFDLDKPPSLAALLDAQARGIQIETERIAGRLEVMRALAQGWPVITVRTLPGGAEHAEYIRNYDEDLGVQIHGSGWAIYWEPWESLEQGGSLTQLHRLTKAPWKPVPHRDYMEAEQPAFDQGVLTVPEIRAYVGWPVPSLEYQNVRVLFEDYGEVKANDPNVGREAVWFSTTETLHLPVLMLGGVRYERVSVTKPKLKIIGWEAKTHA